MIRRYFLFGFIFFLVSFSSFAQYEQTGGFARLQGMGNNLYIVDPYNMTANPAWAGYYHNFLFGDLGSSNGPFNPGAGQFVAANFHVGGGLSLGGMLARNTFSGISISNLDPFGVVGQLNSVVGNTVVINPDNNLELLASYKAGNTAFGFGVAYASTTNETSPAGGTTSTGSASQLGFNAGIVTKLTGSFLLDLGASLVMPNAKFEPGGTGNTSEVSQTIILVNGRIFWQYSSKLAFVPVISFATTSGTVDNGTTATTTSTDLVSNTLIVVGIGMNYHVGDFLLAGGPGFGTASATTSSTPTTPEVSTSAFIFPIWNLGAEWNMNDWFVARIGYIASTQSTTVETPVSATTFDERIFTQFLGPQGATVGVGFRLGNFSLDATVNEDALRQGFNNIGTYGSATFAYLSASLSIP